MIWFQATIIRIGNLLHTALLYFARAATYVVLLWGCLSNVELLPEASVLSVSASSGALQGSTAAAACAFPPRCAAWWACARPSAAPPPRAPPTTPSPSWPLARTRAALRTPRSSTRPSPTQVGRDLLVYTMCSLSAPHTASQSVSHGQASLAREIVGACGGREAAPCAVGLLLVFDLLCMPRKRLSLRHVHDSAVGRTGAMTLTCCSPAPDLACRHGRGGRGMLPAAGAGGGAAAAVRRQPQRGRAGAAAEGAPRGRLLAPVQGRRARGGCCLPGRCVAAGGARLRGDCPSIRRLYCSLLSKDHSEQKNATC